MSRLVHGSAVALRNVMYHITPNPAKFSTDPLPRSFEVGYGTKQERTGVA